MMIVLTEDEELSERRHAFALIKPGRLFSFSRMGPGGGTRHCIAVAYEGGEDRIWHVIELHNHNLKVFAKEAANRICLPIEVSPLIGEAPYIDKVKFDEMFGLTIHNVKTREEKPGDFDRSTRETFQRTYQTFLNNPNNYEDG